MQTIYFTNARKRLVWGNIGPPNRSKAQWFHVFPSGPQSANSSKTFAPKDNEMLFVLSIDRLSIIIISLHIFFAAEMTSPIILSSFKLDHPLFNVQYMSE